MATRSSIFAAVLLGSFGVWAGEPDVAQNPNGVAAASMKEKSLIEIILKPSMGVGKLRVEYSVVNRTSEPIFVFDRMWGRDKNRIDANWAYVAISGNKAVLKRALEPMPAGLTMEELPEPYGCEIEAGGTVKGVFRLDLPLAQSGAI